MLCRDVACFFCTLDRVAIGILLPRCPIELAFFCRLCLGNLFLCNSLRRFAHHPPQARRCRAPSCVCLPAQPDSRLSTSRERNLHPSFRPATASKGRAVDDRPSRPPQKILTFPLRALRANPLQRSSAVPRYSAYADTPTRRTADTFPPSSGERNWPVCRPPVKQDES